MGRQRHKGDRLTKLAEPSIYTGERFGGWLVLTGEVHMRNTSGLIKLIRAQCNCGSTRWLRSSNLTGGMSRSCGCQRTINHAWRWHWLRASPGDTDGSEAEQLEHRSFYGHAACARDAEMHRLSVMTRLKRGDSQFISPRNGRLYLSMGPVPLKDVVMIERHSLIQGRVCIHVDATLNERERDDVIRCYQQGQAVKDIAEDYACSTATIGNVLRRWRREQEALGLRPFYQTNRGQRTPYFNTPNPQP